MPEQKNLDIVKNQFEKAPVYEQGEKSSFRPEEKSEYNAEKFDQIAQGQTGQAQAATSDLAARQSLADDSAIVLTKVEGLLSKDMEEVFLSMDASTQIIFKQKGEETAKKINSLLKNTKVKFNEILSLIINWLKIIPRVNKYYLEQEAKIKTDAIIKLHSKK